MPVEEKVWTWRYRFEEWVKALGLPPEIVERLASGGIVEVDKATGDLVISWVEEENV